MAGHLAVVVPYRDREAHLRRLYPALAQALFDQLGDAFRIYVVEQAPGRPFNRGLIRNAGYAIARADDVPSQVCFHDVDYLPVAADYSPVEAPTRLIWHGLRNVEDYDVFFGGVVALPASDFERINGYGNVYWEWGCEDFELRLRCMAARLPVRYRDGTFAPILHRQEGVQRDGSLTEAAKRMEALLHSRVGGLKDGSVQRADGLSTARYRETARQRVAARGTPDAPHGWHVRVEV